VIDDVMLAAGSAREMGGRIPIYKMAMKEDRWGAIFPGKFVPVLKIEGNFSHLRARPAHFVGHLPITSNA
jgi:hypothetical protein